MIECKYITVKSKKKKAHTHKYITVESKKKKAYTHTHKYITAESKKKEASAHTHVRNIDYYYILITYGYL